MDEVIGRAGFHVTHTKDTSERVAILHEMMRELDVDSIAYWAERNPNIVRADEVLNEAYVNDLGGGFRRCVDRKDVLEYGDDRIAMVKRKLRGDKPHPKTGKMQGGTVTTTMIVAHLPKSMCVEIPDFYPVLDTKTGAPVHNSDGSVMTRSRWVARDRDEARRYFMDLLEVVETEIIPGGHAAVHGIDIQHSESTPHVQILADTFAEDPADAEALRAEASRAWFSHREVLDEKGRQKSGKVKLSEYHARLKAALIEKGYDISPDFDEERHMVGFAKDEYAQVQDQRRVNADRAALLAGAQHQLNAERASVEATSRRLNAHLKVIDEQRDAAIEVGRAEGLQELADERWAAERARTAAEAAAAAARAHEQRLLELLKQVERDLDQAGTQPQPPSYDDLKAELLESQSDIAIRFLKSQRLKDGSTLFEHFQSFARAEFAKQQDAGDAILDRNGSTRFQTWLSRTRAAQRRIDRANLRIVGNSGERSDRDSRSQFGS